MPAVVKLAILALAPCQHALFGFYIEPTKEPK